LLWRLSFLRLIIIIIVIIIIVIFLLKPHLRIEGRVEMIFSNLLLLRVSPFL
jgi:hypothetical protein